MEKTKDKGYISAYNNVEMDEDKVRNHRISNTNAD